MLCVIEYNLQYSAPEAKRGICYIMVFIRSYVPFF
jgi:hypothetical protein